VKEFTGCEETEDCTGIAGGEKVGLKDFEGEEGYGRDGGIVFIGC
jgi:hypothetical protein